MSNWSNKTEATCPHCNTLKPISEFYQNARGYSRWCKECLRAYSKQRVEDGRDKKSKEKFKEKHGYTSCIKSEIERRKQPKIVIDDIHRLASDVYFNAKKRALYLNRDFEITLDETIERIREFCNNNYCVIVKEKNPFKPSLDRIDNSKGYTSDNIKVVWQIENYCKNTYTENDVIEFCKRKLGLL